MLTERDIIYEIACRAELTLEAAGRAYQALRGILQQKDTEKTTLPDNILPLLSKSTLSPNKLPSNR